MARKRMIDPNFWSDEVVGKWSFAARLFYIGLWNFADDKGRFRAHTDLIKSEIFPYDSNIIVENLKTELGDRVQWYEIDGQQYGNIRNFLKYQRIDRPSKSHIPPPPEHSTNTRRTLVSEVNISQVKLSEVNKSQVNIDCKLDLYKILKLTPLKEHDSLINFFCKGLRDRSRCYDPKKCESWLRELVLKSVEHDPDNLYGYLKRTIDNFHKGEGFKS